MGVLGKARELRWRAAGHGRVLATEFSDPLRDATLLELGGPSGVFTAGGLLPVYPLARSVDCVQWAASTSWHELDSGAGFRPEGDACGELLIFDDVELGPIGDARYDAVISSHVIEHIANPLRALEAWRRVTVPNGHLLLVAPHRDGTFDHRREPTTLEHMVGDFEQGVGEDDLTHLDETLELHDRDRDSDDSERAHWERERRENPRTRLLHHHVFTTPSLIALLDHASLQLLATEARFPHDIYVLGRWCAPGQRPENAGFLAERRRSPFRSDR